MDRRVEEALRAKSIAEKQFAQRDFVGAKNHALKSQMTCPELEGISQMVATFGVYAASEAKINRELDFYSILGMDPSSERSKLKKQYKKLAILLHPDKNKTVGADGAFRLVSEAWTLLSDRAKRSAYDERRNSYFPPSHGRVDSFWTICTSCHVQYEYLRKYVNKRLSCKNCRGVFIAVETGLAPGDGSFPNPHCNYSYAPENGYGSHGYGVTSVPTTAAYGAQNGSLGNHTAYGSNNISFQGNSSGKSAPVTDRNGLSQSSFLFYQTNGEAEKVKSNEKHHAVKATHHVGSNGLNEGSKPKRGRPSKKRKVELGNMCTVKHEEKGPKITNEPKLANGNGILKPASKLFSPSETSTRRSLTTPAFDSRQFLLDKARSVIRSKLEEMRLADANKPAEVTVVKGSTVSGNQPELKKPASSMSITVPDSDFHDFDQDRSEELFKPKQIWALYDEEDGMPRLYCLIREIVSLDPFKIYISYLSSKTDTEFGSVNWLDSGFTKSCGSFRVFHSEMVDQVNIFSHLLSREKAGRGGCVRIYPRSGDIWAVYRNWSLDWDRTTPYEIRHQYEMVEVLDNYSEENGVWVTPLVKLNGFKTVYQRNKNTNAVRWIPRREMLRFSHQVPSYSLKGEGTNLPEGCWDLDPAATPDQLLQEETQIHNNLDSGSDVKFVQVENYVSNQDTQHHDNPDAGAEVKLNSVSSQETQLHNNLDAGSEVKLGQNQNFCSNQETQLDDNLDDAGFEVKFSQSEDFVSSQEAQLHNNLDAGFEVKFGESENFVSSRETQLHNNLGAGFEVKASQSENFGSSQETRLHSNFDAGFEVKCTLDEIFGPSHETPPHNSLDQPCDMEFSQTEMFGSNQESQLHNNLDAGFELKFNLNENFGSGQENWACIEEITSVVFPQGENIVKDGSEHSG